MGPGRSGSNGITAALTEGVRRVGKSALGKEFTAKGHGLMSDAFNVEKDVRLRGVDFILSHDGMVIPVEVKHHISGVTRPWTGPCRSTRT